MANHAWGQSVISSAMYIATFVLTIVALTRNDWFHSSASISCVGGIDEGLYKSCCNGVCKTLKHTSTEQTNAQNLVPVVLALAVLGIALNGATAWGEYDHKALASARLINAAALTAIGIIVTAQMHVFHGDELDAGTRSLDDAYYVFAAAWAITGLDLLMLQPQKLFALTLGKGFTYTAMGARAE
jgi:hypothetical protein